MAKIAIDIIGSEQDAARAVASMQKEVSKLRSDLRGARDDAKSTGKQISGSMGAAVEGAAKTIGGMIGVQQAVQAAAAAYSTLTANIRETADAAMKAAGQMRGFAASQVGDASTRTRLTQASGLFIQHGITREDRPQALNLLQTLQDAMGGDFKRAAKEADELFTLREIGVPTEALDSLGVMAAARGVDPGELARKVFEAGEATGVGPGDMSRLMPSIDLYRNADEGLAVGAVLATNLGDRRAIAATAAVSQLFGPNAPDALRKAMKRQGIGADASPMEAIDQLAVGGTRTVEQFQALGVDASSANALAILARERAKVADLTERLPSLSTEARAAARLAAIEEENPEFRLERQNRRIRAASEFDQEFGPLAVQALMKERGDLLRGRALRLSGIEQVMGFDTIDKEGRSTQVDVALATSGPTGRADLGTISGNLERARRESERDFDPMIQALTKVGDRIEQGLKRVESAVGRVRGGSTLVGPSTEDR